MTGSSPSLQAAGCCTRHCQGIELPGLLRRHSDLCLSGLVNRDLQMRSRVAARARYFEALHRGLSSCGGSSQSSATQGSLASRRTPVGGRACSEAQVLARRVAASKQDRPGELQTRFTNHAQSPRMILPARLVFTHRHCGRGLAVVEWRHLCAPRPRPSQH